MAPYLAPDATTRGLQADRDDNNNKGAAQAGNNSTHPLVAEAQALANAGLKIITVIPEALDPERWPLLRDGKPVIDKETGKPKPRFSGKNPSCWRSDGEPQLLSHAKPETVDRVIQHLQEAISAERPIGLAVIPSAHVVVIDFDTKHYEGGEVELKADYDRLVKAHPELGRTRTERTRSGGIHIYLRVSDHMTTWLKANGKGHHCNFTTSRNGPHRGEVLCGTRISVAAPTKSSQGSYSLLPGTEPYAHTLVMVVDLAAVGITKAATKGGRGRTSQSRPQQASRSPKSKGGDGEIDPPSLRDLLRKKAQGVLRGETPYGDDRSSNYAGFLRELFGCLNWLRRQSLPYRGDADELKAEAITALGLEDKADRVEESIDPETCTWCDDDDAAMARYREVGGLRAQETTAQEPYRVLGWCSERRNIFYQHSETGQIASIKPTPSIGIFLLMADLFYWRCSFPLGKEGEGTNWLAALEYIIALANKAGTFELERLRGRGVWIDGKSVVWHLGNRLEVDGKEVELISHKSAHHYPRLPALDVDPSVAPLTDAEGAEILAAVTAMGWVTPLDPLHLLGWVVLANVGGALEKRPILQITSRFGSGKTYTRERVLEPLLAGLALSRSNSTEAGIRQRLKADTLPVLIDESEGEDRARRDGHLRLARLSYDGSPTDRGTTHGQSLSFAVRSSVALMGINATIANMAERSRTVVVGRDQIPPTAWAPVDHRIRELLTTSAGARLLRRVVTHLPTLRSNVATFRRVVEAQLAGTAAARAGDTYGALLAGTHLLVSTTLVDDVQALTWLDHNRWSAAEALGELGGEAEDGAAESLQCLRRLLSHEEFWRADNGTGRITIRELINLARVQSASDDVEQARKALGRRGLKAEDVGLLVANSGEPLEPIYGATKWRDGGHRARLSELPGCYAKGAVRFAALGTHRALCIPWEVVA